MRRSRSRVLGLSNRAIMLFLFGIAVGVFCILWSLVSMLDSAAQTMTERKQYEPETPPAPERSVRLVDAAPAGEAFGGACALVNRWGGLEVWWFGPDGEGLGGVPAVGTEGRIAGCADCLIVASDKALTQIRPDSGRDVIDLPDGYTAPTPDMLVGCSDADATGVLLMLGDRTWAIHDGVAEPAAAEAPRPEGAARPRIDEDADREWAWLPLPGGRQATVVLEGDSVRLNRAGRSGAPAEAEPGEEP